MLWALVDSGIQTQGGGCVHTHTYMYTHRALLGETSGTDCLFGGTEEAVLNLKASPVQSSGFSVNIMFFCSSAG